MNSKSESFAKKYFDELNQVLEMLDFKQLEKLADIVWKAYKRDATVFFIGNGGSASTATHLAADIGKNVRIKIKTLSLTDNTAWLTALGNDLSYDDIFVEQFKNFAKKGDVLIAVSGSGNSPNIVKTVDYANKIGAYTVGLLGFNGGKMLKKVKLVVLVPVEHYGYVEGVHSEIHHYLVEALKLKKKNDE